MKEKFEQMLFNSVNNISLTDEETRLLKWLAGYDAWTIENMCSIIEKCRKENQ